MFFLVKFWYYTTCVEVAQSMQHYWAIVRKGLHWFQILSTKSLNLLRKGEGCTFNFFCNLILLNKYYSLFLIQCFFFFWETYSKKRKKKEKKKKQGFNVIIGSLPLWQSNHYGNLHHCPHFFERDKERFAGICFESAICLFKGPL